MTTVKVVVERASVLAGPRTDFKTKEGVRCTFEIKGDPAAVVAQLDNVGCLTLTYRATPDAAPQCFFVGFMSDLARMGMNPAIVLSEEDGTFTVR